MSEVIQCDPAAERALLASLFRGGFQTYAEVGDIISVNDFAIQNNQLIYKCFEKVFDSPDVKVDVPGIMSAAMELGFDDFLNKKESADHLRAISTFPADVTNCVKFAKQIRKLSLYRRLGSELFEAREEVGAATGGEPIAEVLGRVENRILDFGQMIEGQSNGSHLLGDFAPSYIEDLLTNAQSLGIKTCFTRWEENIGGGLLPNSLELIGARTKTGKSLFANALMLSVAEQGIPVFDVQTEMSTEEQIRRMIAAMSGVVEREIRDGLIKDDKEKMRKVLGAVEKLKSMPIHHQHVGELGIEGIVAAIRRWMITKVGLDHTGKVKPCLVVFDYFKLTQSSDMGKEMQEYQSMGFMATAIKNLMKKYDGRCVSFVQLNRQGIETEDESVIAQSDRLSWYASSFSILKWLSPEEHAEMKDKTLTHKLINVLSRHGGTQRPGDFIYVGSNTKTCSMWEGPGRDELASMQRLGVAVKPNHPF